MKDTGRKRERERDKGMEREREHIKTKEKCDVREGGDASASGKKLWKRF